MSEQSNCEKEVLSFGGHVSDVMSCSDRVRACRGSIKGKL